MKHYSSHDPSLAKIEPEEEVIGIDGLSKFCADLGLDAADVSSDT